MKLLHIATKFYSQFPYWMPWHEKYLLCQIYTQRYTLCCCCLSGFPAWNLPIHSAYPLHCCALDRQLLLSTVRSSWCSTHRAVPCRIASQVLTWIMGTLCSSPAAPVRPRCSQNQTAGPSLSVLLTRSHHPSHTGTWPITTNHSPWWYLSLLPICFLACLTLEVTQTTDGRSKSLECKTSEWMMDFCRALSELHSDKGKINAKRAWSKLNTYKLENKAISLITTTIYRIDIEERKHYTSSNIYFCLPFRLE